MTALLGNAFLVGVVMVASRCLAIASNRLLSNAVSARLLSTSGDTTSSPNIRSYCETETFHAACPSDDDVIVMTHAYYGRMRISRCVKLDYGHVGCMSDVITVADKRCSGRKYCEIRIPDPELAKSTPCPEDLKPYFEADYACVKVNAAPADRCLANEPPPTFYVSQTTVGHQYGGYLASHVTWATGCGSLASPWSLEARPGQTFRIVLYDFTVKSTSSGTTSVDDKTSNRQQQQLLPDSSVPLADCPVYAVVSERVTAAAAAESTDGVIGRRTGRNVTVCGGNRKRESVVYVTSSNRVDIGLHVEMFTGETGSGEDDIPYFLLRYEVVGCADLPPVDGTWYTRQVERRISANADDINQRQQLTVRCNHSSDVYRLTCSKDNVWIGPSNWNCTVNRTANGFVQIPNVSGRPRQLHQEPASVAAFIIVIGVALIIGVIVLSVGLYALRRSSALYGGSPPFGTMPSSLLGVKSQVLMTSLPNSGHNDVIATTAAFYGRFSEPVPIYGSFVTSVGEGSSSHIERSHLALQPGYVFPKFQYRDQQQCISWPQSSVRAVCRRPVHTDRLDRLRLHKNCFYPNASNWPLNEQCAESSADPDSNAPSWYPSAYRWLTYATEINSGIDVEGQRSGQPRRSNEQPFQLRSGSVSSTVSTSATGPLATASGTFTSNSTLTSFARVATSADDVTSGCDDDSKCHATTFHLTNLQPNDMSL